MSKSKNNLQRSPKKIKQQAEAKDATFEVWVKERMQCYNDYMDSLCFDDDAMDFVTEYEDTYDYPGYDMIPARKDYPKREIGIVRVTHKGPSIAIQELAEYVINNTSFPENNEILNDEEHMKAYYELSDMAMFTSTVNQTWDYGEALVNYAYNLVDGILDLPKSARRQQLLLAFSMHDLLDTITNYGSSRTSCVSMIADSAIQTIRDLADGKITKEEALRFAKEAEAKCQGLEYLNEAGAYTKLIDVSNRLEQAGFPSRDDRFVDDED